MRTDQEKKGILFDSTLCIGCGACYQACKERNQLRPTTDDFLQDDLSENTYTVVKKGEGGYVRRLCMHCQVPTCVSVCPVGALEKTEFGPVIYHEDRCIGCRYCMQACPFNVPRYEWYDVTPRVRKCDMCYSRIASGLPTACTEVCPTGATTFGNRSELIQIARSRIRESPDRYTDGIYGLEEVGGTSVLLLAAISLESFGYRSDLLKEPLPLLTWQVLQKIPNLVVVGGVLLGGIWWITNRRDEVRRIEGPGLKSGHTPEGTDQSKNTVHH